MSCMGLLVRRGHIKHLLPEPRLDPIFDMLLSVVYKVDQDTAYLGMAA